MTTWKLPASLKTILLFCDNTRHEKTHRGHLFWFWGSYPQSSASPSPIAEQLAHRWPPEQRTLFWPEWRTNKIIYYKHWVKEFKVKCQLLTIHILNHCACFCFLFGFAICVCICEIRNLSVVEDLHIEELRCTWVYCLTGLWQLHRPCNLFYWTLTQEKKLL